MVDAAIANARFEDGPPTSWIESTEIRDTILLIPANAMSKRQEKVRHIYKNSGVYRVREGQ